MRNPIKKMSEAAKKRFKKSLKTWHIMDLRSSAFEVYQESSPLCFDQYQSIKKEISQREKRGLPSAYGNSAY